MKKPFLLLLPLLAVLSLKAQEITRKQMNAVRTEGGIKIDGVLNESDWMKATPADNFIQKELTPGAPATQKTEVRVLYTDKAIFIGAQLFDQQPDSILKELTLRDKIGNTDYFGVLLDTYKDGNNGFGFVVTPAGIQADARYYPDASNGLGFKEDWGWNAVWKSEARITSDGWIVEMEIPFSAIRFPSATEQGWRINFARVIRRNREQVFWNEIHPNIPGLVSQSGEILGISNVKSPFRLQAFPFVSAYAENTRTKENGQINSSWGKSFTGGMDVKYGINDAFTLDMTLIPDFGQVQSDNRVLNLSPFEVRFDENRQFFTEGVELFNKGRFFYSRRVGSIPQYFKDEMNAKISNQNDTLVSMPNDAQLYNASKVSGRMQNGLGIGVFNATSAPAYAVIKKADGNEHNEEVYPLTNYNVVSFDKNLQHNSYFTLVNTNIVRNGTAYDANVTGIDFNIKNKTNTYAVNGNAGLAQRHFTNNTEWSYKYDWGLSKISGKWQWGVFQNYEKYNYNPNDMGYLLSPNENTWGTYGSYNSFQPKGNFNRWNVSSDIFYSRLQRPNVYSDFAINLSSFFLTKKIFAFGINSRLEPFNTRDYFEPRTTDFSRYFLYIQNYSLGGFISTDYRKPFALDYSVNSRFFLRRGQKSFSMGLSPRVRFNDHFSLLWSINVSNAHRYPNYISTDSTSVGYSLLPQNDIILGERNQLVLTNTPSVKLNFNSKMGIDFRLRHYWTKVRFDDFFHLDTDGRLVETSYKGKTDASEPLHYTNFNIFNIDASFTWRFAPGSDMIVNWKNSVAGADTDVAKNYFQNISTMFENPMNNSLSVRVIYFLDYINFVKTKGKV